MRLLTRSPQIFTSTESDLQKLTTGQENCDLELIPTEQIDRSARKIQSILALIANLWQKMITALTEDPELKIWQTQDCYGNIHWHAYDPCMSKSVSFASELEMMRWIENGYSRW